MKVILESMGRTRFPVEVTMKELKEKIRKALFIPKAKQFLYLNGNLLWNDIVDLIDIKHGSVTKFRVTGVHPAPAPKPEAEIINFQIAISPSETIAVKMHGRDTVRELKEKIHRIEGIPAHHIMITTQDGITDIPDCRRLRDFSISFLSRLTVAFLSFGARPRKSRLKVVSFSTSPSPSSPPPPRNRSRLSSVMSTASSSSTPAVVLVDMGKMSVVLQFRGKNLPAPVEVGRADMVRELRTRLETMNIKVPGNRDYIFLHKLLLLDKDRSFASQNVADGDIIYIRSSRTGY